MKMEIKNEKENKLMERKELEAEFSGFTKTPTRKEVLKEVAGKKGVKEELIIIETINQVFGQKKANAIIRVYKERKQLERFEHKHLIKRLQGKEEAEAMAVAASGKKAEEPKKEAHAKEKKE